MEPNFIVIDLFCGFGGTTLGFEMAGDIAKVIACVNHDPKAIKSHWLNNPGVKHFEEDIRTLDLTELIQLVNKYRALYPNAKVILWASLECTNYSKAKGGMSRDADSRTLAEHLDRYIIALDPDYIQIENVVEFLDWGPLMIKEVQAENGLSCPIIWNKKTNSFSCVWVPDPKHKGEDFNRWCNEINLLGYYNDWTKLNSADFGAYTSRLRLFGCFAKPEYPIVFPSPSHTKKPKQNTLFPEELEKWKPVKDVLDFSVLGKSIFDREKPLVENTLERIYAGLIKFVAGGKDKWLLKYNSLNGKTRKHVPPSIDEPCPVISCQGRLGLFQTSFVSQYNGGNADSRNISLEQPFRTLTTNNRFAVGNTSFVTKHFSGHPESKSKSIEEPAGAITNIDHHSLVNTEFLSTYYGNGGNHSINEPCPTLTTKDRVSIISNHFIDMQYGNGSPMSINDSAATLTTNPKHQLVSCNKWIMNTNFNNVGSSVENPNATITADRHHHYLMNPQYNSEGSSIENPCFTLIAKMDKRPPYLITTENNLNKTPSFIKIQGNTIIYEIYNDDSPTMVKIKEFMAMYLILDVKMRMLLINELLKVQGFPEDYKMVGSQADKKKFIGNSVVPLVVKKWIKALNKEVIKYRKAS